MHDVLATDRVHNFDTLRELRGLVPTATPVDFARVVNARRNMTGIVNVAAGNDPDAAPISAAIQQMRTSWGPRVRWITVCECKGAEDVTPEYPWFFCLSCLNVDYEGKWRPLVFPEKRERRRIESLILERIDPSYWSYAPGETPAEIEEQNVALWWRW